jgi:hypothetical protein
MVGECNNTNGWTNWLSSYYASHSGRDVLLPGALCGVVTHTAVADYSRCRLNRVLFNSRRVPRPYSTLSTLVRLRSWPTRTAATCPATYDADPIRLRNDLANDL